MVSGSGDGLVDAAAAGVIDGSELVLYSASFEGDTLIDLIDQSSRLVVTDSNRDRAHHWRSSQDVTGYTESGDPEPGVLRYESGDQRLPVFETTDPATQTVSVQDGPVTATASSYGEPFAYLPEHRPVMAIDGDPATSWLVADRAPAVDEFISFDVSEPVDHITLRQPDTPDGTRRISSVEILVDGGVDGAEPIAVDLDERSLVDGGSTDRHHPDRRRRARSSSASRARVPARSRCHRSARRWQRSASPRCPSESGTRRSSRPTN